VIAQRAQVFHVDATTLDFHIQLFLDGIGHVAGRDGAEKLAAIAGAKLEFKLLAIEQGLDLFRILCFAGDHRLKLLLFAFNELEVCLVGDQRHQARFEEVAEISALHIHLLASLAKVID